LLDAGADIDAAYEYGGTAICSAIRKRHFAMVQLLLARGADVTFHHENCSSCLEVAIGKEDSRVIELLLLWGAKVDVSIFEGTGEIS
jgi:ankyrin repeat protein